MSKKTKKKSNAGRKPVDDPKVQICIYPEQSIVDKLGKEEIQEIAIKAVRNAAKKKRYGGQ